MSSEPDRGKRPATVLAGPYGHPFHPILVTVPIGAWLASIVFDVASRLAEGDAAAFALAAKWLLGLGVLGALAAAMVGFLDLFVIPTGTRAFRVGLVHMTLNLVVTAAFALSFAVRDREPTGTGLLVLSVVAFLVLGVSGWLGGMLAYRYGVRVAAESDQAQGFRA